MAYNIVNPSNIGLERSLGTSIQTTVLIELVETLTTCAIGLGINTSQTPVITRPTRATISLSHDGASRVAHAVVQQVGR